MQVAQRRARHAVIARRQRRQRLAAALCVLAVIALAVRPAAAASTIERIRAAGAFACGVVTEPAEEDKVDRHGDLSALEGEICKAVGTAVLGDGATVRLTPYRSEIDAIEGLQHGQVDLLAGVTPGATAIWANGAAFGPPVFFDAQAVMVDKASGIGTLAQLGNRKVCFLDLTEPQRVFDGAMRARRVATIPFPFQEQGEMDAAVAVGHCDAVTADLSRLADSRARFHGRAGDFVFLPELLALDPVATAYRQGDPQWAGTVAYTLSALVQAEASGVTRANVAEKVGSDDLAVQRLLGVDFAVARAFGLAPDWAVKVIAAVGNYGEIYERTAGEQSPLRLPRGLNALWSAGGLMYPLPMR